MPSGFKSLVRVGFGRYPLRFGSGSDKIEQQIRTAEENLKLIHAPDDQYGYEKISQDELKEKYETIGKLKKEFAKVDQALQEAKY